VAEISYKDRAVGAIMGTLVGDALGLGCHWYYDLELLRADYGNWVSDYTDQKPDRTDMFGKIARHRHEFGLRAGDLSQSGDLVVMLMDSVANCGGYDEDDYTSRFDAFLETLDGREMREHAGGSVAGLCGGFTDRAVRHLWKHRQLGIPWGEAGSVTDTSEAAQRAVVFAALHGDDYEAMAKQAYKHIKLTHRDRYVAGYSLSYMLSAASLINGITLGNIREHVIQFARNPAIEPMLSSFDINKQIGSGWPGADPSIEVDPRIVCLLFGLDCTMGFLAPAAYFLIHRFPDDFEKAVLYAVNSGGNTMARAALTGGLSGAMVGIQGIPERFIAGLKDHERLLGLAEKIADKPMQDLRKAS
jgi:ADP-ribosylglycohydrolase